MISLIKKKTTLSIAAAGAALVVLGFVLGGVATGVGALAGVAVALGDWWVIARFSSALVGRQGGHWLTGSMITAKMTLLLGLCWALLARLEVDPLGFCLGLSSLVLGVLYAATTPTESAPFAQASFPEEGGLDASR